MRRGGQGILKILCNSHSFVYFYFFGFHEILKNIKNIKTTLNTCFTQQCYIRIILHHTVASAYSCIRLLHQHSIAALAQYCIRPLHQLNITPDIASVPCNGTINHLITQLVISVKNVGHSSIGGGGEGGVEGGGGQGLKSHLTTVQFLYKNLVKLFLDIVSAKSCSTRGASHQPAFMGSCLLFTRLPCLPRR